MPDLDATTPNPALVVQTGQWQTATNIVMSGDDTANPRSSTPRSVRQHRPRHLTRISVSLRLRSIRFCRECHPSRVRDRETTIATTLVKVGETIKEGKAGVLVTDFTTNRTILQKIINALKQRMPELVTIVVSDFKDSTDMINLINYGQIYRYSTKPIEAVQLRMDINAAVLHITCRCVRILIRTNVIRSWTLRNRRSPVRPSANSSIAFASRPPMKPKPWITRTTEMRPHK